MNEQINLFGDEVDVTRKRTDNEKRNWENAFQKWSNEQGMDATTEHYGKCGYGSMCDYCDDNTYGRPCVRGLNELCRIEHIDIDYKRRNFEDVWCGEFAKRSGNNDL